MKKINVAVMTAGALSAALLAGQSVFAQNDKPVAVKPAATKVAKAAPATAKPAEKAEDLWGFLPAVVAEVNGKKVTKEDIVKIFTAQFPDGQVPPMFTRQMLEKFAPQVIKQMVDTMALLNLAEKDGIKPDKKATVAALNEMIKNIPPEQLDMEKQKLAAQNMTMESYIEKTADNKIVQESFAIRQWLDKNVLTNLKATDQEVEAFYKENKANFKVPGDPEGSVRASHILISLKDETPAADKEAKEKAEKILARLKAGETFEKLAEAESACPSKKAGGSLGAFSKGQMVPEFEAAAFELKDGQVSGVVKTKFGYHIIRRDKAVKESEKSFADVKGAIENVVKSKKAEEAIKAILAKATVEQGIKILVTAPPPAAPVPAAKAVPAPVAAPATK
ncbi:MAG: peptidylprolyl isomerase [Victivallaceae bacterium]|jgi:peptidyl-prolyl cis-trans isomerase C